MSETTEPEKSPFGEAPGEIVHEEHTKDFSLQIVVSDDEMTATVSLLPKKPKEDLITSTELIKILSNCGIEDGIDMKRIDAFCAQGCKGKNQRNIMVAATLPPEPGADGWLEVKIRTDNVAQYEEDDKGRIDLYTLNLFSSVDPEQEVAILHPPELGEASSTVTGKILPPVLGKEPEVRLGSGVRVEDGGSRFIAEIAGRVELTENVLTVSEDFIVHGDVDLQVGNINFPGYTKVRGDVLDNFDIRSIKGIDIGGAVGTCHLTSDGDITIGSMAGRDEGVIHCGGNLKANYLNGVYVECMGTVTISNEVRNCVIKSAKTITVKNGLISGGECIALEGIEVGDVGATAGVITRLCSGVYFPETDRLQMLKAQQKSISVQNQFIAHSLGPLKKEAGNDSSTTGAVQKRLEILMERLELLKVMSKEVNTELNNFVFEDHEGNAKINIHKRLREKVIISLGLVTEEIRYEHYGPLSVIADVANGILHFGEMSALTINADTMDTDSEESNASPQEIDEVVN